MSFQTADALKAAIVDGTLTRERACDGKRAYRTVEYAEQVRTRVEAQTGQDLLVYRCPFCGRHHLAHRTAVHESRRPS